MPSEFDDLTPYYCEHPYLIIYKNIKVDIECFTRFDVQLNNKIILYYPVFDKENSIKLAEIFDDNSKVLHSRATQLYLNNLQGITAIVTGTRDILYSRGDGYLPDGKYNMVIRVNMDKETNYRDIIDSGFIAKEMKKVHKLTKFDVMDI
jgi:hypothetical protein